MRRREQQDAELLDRYWSALFGDPAAPVPGELDPQTALVTRRLVDGLRPPEPESAFAGQLRRRLQAQEPPASPAGVERADRWLPPWRLRRVAAVAAALLLAAILVGGGVYAALNVFPGSPPPPASLEDLRLVAQGVDKSAGVSGREVGYAFIVKNPSEDLAAEGATYRVTAYGLRGAVLATGSGSIPVLLPGQRLGIGGFLSLTSGEAVDRLNIEIESGALVEPEAQPALVAEAAEYRPDGEAPKVTGIVRNPAQEDAEQVRVSAVAYSAEGIIIGGGGVVLDSVPAGGREFVEVPVTTSEPPAKVELYASVSRLPAGTR